MRQADPSPDVAQTAEALQLLLAQPLGRLGIGRKPGGASHLPPPGESFASR